MNTQSIQRIASKRWVYLMMTTLIFFIVSPTTLAHGPKGHGGIEFTALQAVQKGLNLYDRLVESGKLEEAWETGLKNVEVSQKQKGKESEFIVKFSRSEGEPRSVYIFLMKRGIIRDPTSPETRRSMQ